MTPLHLAALSGSIRLTRKLLLKGASRYVKDFSGKTPLDISIDNSFNTISVMLQDQGMIEECTSMK
jgi:ankyrin repeat protein